LYQSVAVLQINLFHGVLLLSMCQEKLEDTVPLTCIVVLHKFRPARMEQ